ncbi:MAG: diguanylate cyclase [Roseobacter sp.]
MIERTFANAEDLVDLVAVSARHYIDSVSGLPLAELTSNPEDGSDRTWMPATFAKRYTQSYSDQKPGLDFRIYSRDPFNYNRNRVLDDFGKAALDAILPGGVPDYRAVEELGDGTVRVRLARAFTMDENCVACHNMPEWGLKHQAWKVGDVRGVWEASIVVNPNILHTQAEMFGLLMFTGIALTLGLFVVFPAVRREVRNSEFFHDRSLQMEEQANQRFKEAHTDVLTQIGNRRYFDAVFEPMLEEHEQKGHAMAVIVLDIDHFKHVNDTHGHDVGDRVLKFVAGVLKRESRTDDKVARTGGEEFILLAPEFAHGGATTMAARIKDCVETQKFTANGSQFNVTVSAGLAYRRKGEQSQDLLKRADQLLYHAKKTGRNKICQSFGAVTDNGVVED